MTAEAGDSRGELEKPGATEGRSSTEGYLAKKDFQFFAKKKKQKKRPNSGYGSGECRFNMPLIEYPA